MVRGVGNGGGVGGGSTSHSSTVEKLYAWEKKLFLEVKVQYHPHSLLLLNFNLFLVLMFGIV